MTDSMKYIILSPDCVVRNERNCSYLARVIKATQKNNFSFDTLPIPPFMGYIFANIGKYPVPVCFDKVAKDLGVSTTSVECFVNQLLNTSDSRRFKINKEYSVTFPSGLLIESICPDDRMFKMSPDYSLDADFFIKRPDIPFNVNLMTTTACYTDCIYCYADRKITDLLTTDEIISILYNMYEEGVVNVTLTGGDLMMRKDWKVLMERIIKYGYNHFISTKTPLSASDIEYLTELGFKEIQFSLDSVDPHISNELVKGGNDYIHKVDSMLDLCTKKGIDVQIRSVITKLNGSEKSITNLYEFLCSHECVKSWDITPAFFSGYKKQYYKSIEPDNKDLIWAYSFSRKKNLKFPVSTAKINKDGYKLKSCATTSEFVCKNQICLGNVTSISIIANGKCTVCEMLYGEKDYIIGDLRVNSLRDIWNSKIAKQLYSPIQTSFAKDTPCRTCNDFEKCRRDYGKRVCFSDICKTNMRPEDPDPRCPLSKGTRYIL